MNYKKEYLMMKEKYLALKNQLGGFRPPQGVQQTEEQRTKRKALERAAMLSVDQRLVIEKAYEVKQALRRNRKPAIDILHDDVFFHVLTFLSLQELNDMLRTFQHVPVRDKYGIDLNKSNPDDLQKAAMLQDFIKERIDKIKEYKDLKKNNYESFLRADNEAFERLEDEVARQGFDDTFLMRIPSIGEVRDFGKVSYYYRQARRFSPAHEVDYLKNQGFFDVDRMMDEPFVTHRKFRIRDSEVETAVALRFIEMPFKLKYFN